MPSFKIATAAAFVTALILGALGAGAFTEKDDINLGEAIWKWD